MNMPASNNDLEMDSSAQGTYDGDFTETISNQMRMPQTLTVAEENGYLRKNDSYNNAGSMYNNAWRNPALTMEVPERIVVSMGERGVEFGEGKVDLPSPTYYAGGSEHVPVGLKTPPRVLTLHDTNLHSLDVSNRSEGGFENENVENSTKPLKVRNPSDDQLELADQSSIEDLDDISLMRKQIYKLHRRIGVLEKQQQTQLHRDYSIYAITVGLCLLNGWLLYNNRRFY